MITCKEATRYISRKEEGRLSIKQQAQLWMHLAVCSICRLFRQQNSIIITSTRKIEEDSNTALSDHEKQKIIQILEKES